MSDADHDRRSRLELEAGRLPLSAQERLSRITGDSAFTSALSTAEHLTIRWVGFEPVGQVMGASVFHVGFSGSACGWGETVSLEPFRQAVVEAQRLALDRLLQEVLALDGDGAVAVHFTEQRLNSRVVEFMVIGTAVRSTGRTHPDRPFSCAFSGAEFAQVIHGGWVPTSLLFGVSAVGRHVPVLPTGSRSFEVGASTALLRDAQAEARRRLAKAAAADGAEAVVLRYSHRSTTSFGCSRRSRGPARAADQVVRMTHLGTGLAQVRRRQAVDPDVLPILRLTDSHRTRRRS